jgi:putative phosphoesterase
LEIDEVRIALLHGDETAVLDEIVRSQSYDLVVSGHTQSTSKSRTGKTVSLNPGEVCGYLSGNATVAAFDTSTRIIETLNV